MQQSIITFWYYLDILSFNQDKNALIKVATSLLYYDKCSLIVPKRVYSRVRKDYTPLHVYLGCVWVVIYVTNILHTKAYYIIPYHLTLTRARSMYTPNSSFKHEKAPCEWFRLSEPVQAERGSGKQLLS